MRGFLLLLATGAALAAPVVHYEFLREQCSNGRFADSSGLNLVGDLLLDVGHTSCNDWNGIEITGTGTCDSIVPAYSENDVSALASLLAGSSGYTIEIWAEISVPTTTGKTLYFMSVMPDDPSAAGSMCEKAGDVGVGLAESGSNKLLAFNYDYFDTDLNIPLCKTTNVAVSGGFSEVHQYVFQAFHYDDDILGLGYYVDGELKSLREEEFSEYLPAFMDSAHKLFLGSVGSTQPAWACSFQGTMFQFSIYNYTLDATEISDSFDRKIASSLPIAHDDTIVVPEDGKYNTEIEDPADYSAPFPADEVFIVACPYYDFDELNTSFTYKPSNPMARCRIDSIPSPSDAELFTLAGVPITAGTILADEDEAQFRVRPALNRHGFSFDIDFTIIDGVDARENSGTMTISVEAVNDPPKATTTYALATAKVKKAIIDFNVTDVDSTVTGIRVAELPQRGELYTVNFLNTVQSTVLSVGDTLSYLRIGYKYTGDDELMFPERGVVYEDTFKLEFRDAEGLYSAPASVVVTVIPALLAIPSSTSETYSFISASDKVVYEEGGDGAYTDNMFRVYALDYSEPNPDLTFRDLTLAIETVPELGVLSYINGAGDVEELSGGEVLDKPMIFVQSTAQYRLFYMDLLYESAVDYFNSPAKVWQQNVPLSQPTMNFNFHIKEFNTTAIARSEPATQNLTVYNVNDPVSLSVPTERFHVEAVGNNDDGSDILVIDTGFNVTDPDRDASPIRVTIKSSKGGSITLNQAHVGFLDFNSQGICRQADFDNRWKCSGSGSSDASMTFTGTPSAVTAALNGMTYRNTKANILDTVTIRIYDGAFHGPGDEVNTDCIDKADIATSEPSSVFPECHFITASFQVEVGNSAFQPSGDDGDEVPTNVIAASVGLACVAIGIIAVAIRRNFCMAKVETWGESANEDGIDLFTTADIPRLKEEARRKARARLALLPESEQSLVLPTNLTVLSKPPTTRDATPPPPDTTHATSHRNEPSGHVAQVTATESPKPEWVSHVAKSGAYAGRKYYVNRLTRRTTWTEPELLESIEQARASISSPTPRTPPLPDEIRVSFRDVYGEDDPEFQGEAKGPDYI